MAPGLKDFKIWVGNTEWIRFVFKDANNDPFDLSGSRLILKTANDQRWASDDVASPFQIFDDENGIADLKLTPAHTRLFTSDTRYEIERWMDDIQESLVYGNIKPTVWTNDDTDP